MPDTLTVSDPASHVRQLTLARPERRNAIDLAAMQELVAALRAADGDPAVRAIILTGADPAFCAGLDLTALAGGELDLATLEDAADPWQTLQSLRTPTVAAVNGPAVTGGLELVLSCDLAIASDRARFADTHARVGLHSSGGMTVLLPRFVGLRNALGMTLTGRFVGAEEAQVMGLVNAVVAHDRLLDAALATAAAITEVDERAVQALLATYRALDGIPLADALAQERERGRAMTVDVAAVEQRRARIIARGSGLAEQPRES